MYLYTIYHKNLSSTTGNEVKLCLERHIFSQNSCMGRNLFISLQCVFHSIRFKVNKGGVQRYSFFYAFPHRLPSSSIKNHPVRMKNHPVRMNDQPAWMKNQPIWMKILPILDGMTSSPRTKWPALPAPWPKDKLTPSVLRLVRKTVMARHSILPKKRTQERGRERISI